ncbi:peroxiredoxin type-2 [Dimargaris verticillata]|uniref:Peroxiredoxin type-2 n=1 Tax=Dimargaris verticillata TaxID=2761393 RepID=A0A9W8B6B7_9FUNG|nr:peroxiredoxin type-2 [Dimargaris verticillata]
MAQIGDKVPMCENLYVARGESDHVDVILSSDIFKGKKVVAAGITSAFSNLDCKYMLEEYSRSYDDFKRRGIDDVVILSCNDPLVLRAWAKDQPGVEKLRIISDGDTDFHRGLDMAYKIPGMGVRCKRYGMVVVDGVIKHLNVDEAGPHSHIISTPKYLLEELDRGSFNN